MSDSDSNGSEHELSFYSKDKVKLMKEVLKIIKPKKIKAMAPDCIKHLDIAEINSMLLEELLGISNKRLQYIYKGENADRETSSSESEDEEKEAIDVISLDDISDEDFDVCVPSTSQMDSSTDKKGKLGRRQPKHGTKQINKTSSKIKREKKADKSSSNKETFKKESEEEKLMNVLELLELQARARAIRSQLAIESNKHTAQPTATKIKKEDDSDSDAVIIDSPRLNEIVITSESEEDKRTSEKSKEPSEHSSKKQKLDPEKEQPIISDLSEAELNVRKAKLLSKLRKIKLVRNKTNPISNDTNSSQNGSAKNSDSQDQPHRTSTTDDKIVLITPEPKKEENPIEVVSDTSKKSINFCDNDEIVINLDEEEMDDME